MPPIPFLPFHFSIFHFFYIMLVETMTHAEVYDELARDLPNLERWIDRQAKILRRYSLKIDRRNFPRIMYNEYNSPRKIHYRFIAILYKRNETFRNFTYTLRQTRNQVIRRKRPAKDSVHPARHQTLCGKDEARQDGRQARAALARTLNRLCIAQ